MFDTFDFFWNLFPLLFSLGLLSFAAFAVVIIVITLRREKQNDAAPRLTVSAFVAEKETDVTYQQVPAAGDPTGASGYFTHSTTSYYVTFQIPSGDRMRFSVSETVYHTLTERESGNLSFQGTRFLSFEKR
ncbi:MAG: DUF2500 domain-containing protein [Lachnospiraceae bacterium]|nr:DUF2500 domain-containing protein [Lachnospiraceae bacterium]